MADYTLTLDDIQDALLARAATGLHVTPKGALHMLVGQALLLARTQELSVGIPKARDGAEWAAMKAESDGLKATLGRGILDDDDPERLPLPLPVNPVVPLLDPEE